MKLGRAVILFYAAAFVVVCPTTKPRLEWLALNRPNWLPFKPALTPQLELSSLSNHPPCIGQGRYLLTCHRFGTPRCHSLPSCAVQALDLDRSGVPLAMPQ